MSTLAAGPAQARSRRQLPPDVILHPDRGIGISRFSKASHDQRLFKSINNGTRLPGYDPAIDPYNNVLSQGSTYDIQTGQVRGSLSDHYAEIRREEENARRQRQERARQLKAADASNSRHDEVALRCQPRGPVVDVATVGKPTLKTRVERSDPTRVGPCL